MSSAWPTNTKAEIQKRAVGYTGKVPGFISEFARFEDDRLTIIALANGDDVDLPSLVNGVAQPSLSAQ